MNILALDLGTKCGWALSRDGKKPKFGTVDLNKNTNFDGCGVQYLKFEHWLGTQLPLDLIVFESVMGHDARAVHSAHKYGGWLAIVQKFGDQYDIPYSGEGVTTIKKFWLGRGTTTKKGKADKQAMMQKAWDRGFNVKDDNQADAVALLHLALEKYNSLL